MTISGALQAEARTLSEMQSAMDGTPAFVAWQKTTTEILDFVQNDDVGRMTTLGGDFGGVV
jgi:hypothetical protein